MRYIVIFDGPGDSVRALQDDEGSLILFDSERSAYEALEGHLLADYAEVIEI